MRQCALKHTNTFTIIDINYSFYLKKLFVASLVEYEFDKFQILRIIDTISDNFLSLGGDLNELISRLNERDLEDMNVKLRMI